MGCFYDAYDDRILPSAVIDDDNTIESCIEQCRTRNYTFAGVKVSSKLCLRISWWGGGKMREIKHTSNSLYFKYNI